MENAIKLSREDMRKIVGGQSCSANCGNGTTADCSGATCIATDGVGCGASDGHGRSLFLAGLDKHPVDMLRRIGIIKHTRFLMQREHIKHFPSPFNTQNIVHSVFGFFILEGKAGIQQAFRFNPAAF